MKDIGMKEKIGESKKKFEIWFRKRKKNEKLNMKYMSEEIKKVWKEEIYKIIWKKEIRKREMRIDEMY
jgi:hypothetical protein